MEDLKSREFLFILAFYGWLESINDWQMVKVEYHAQIASRIHLYTEFSQSLFFALLSSINILTSTPRVVGNLIYVIFYFSLILSYKQTYTQEIMYTHKYKKIYQLNSW